MSQVQWPKVSITLDDGKTVAASAPLVISASRATDIPACFGSWLIGQLDRGYTVRTNPFNGKPVPLSFDNLKVIAFWTKDAGPFLPFLAELDKRHISCFFQYTLNDYEMEKFEPGIPSLKCRIQTFADLSHRIGKERVLWRFDPIVLTQSLDPHEILRRITALGDQIAPLCSRLTISFLSHYKTVVNRMRSAAIIPLERTQESISIIGSGLAQLGKQWNVPVYTCAETADLSPWGIPAGSCIDPDYILSTFGKLPEVSNLLSCELQQEIFPYREILRKKFRDTGQREHCNCMISKDIGEYGTCTLGCMYCYAGRACSKNTH